MPGCVSLEPCLNPDAKDKIGIVFLLLVLCALLSQEEIVLKGSVSDPHGNALPKALVQLIAHNQVVSQSQSGADGRFLLKVSSTGEFTIKVESEGFRSESRHSSPRATQSTEPQA